MATRTVLGFVLSILVLLSLVLAPLNSGFAQDTKGRWVFGVHVGGNMWMNDYNKRLVGDGGELMLRYGISRAFSAGFLVGFEELKSNQDPALNTVSYMKLNAIPAALVAWFHLVPGKSADPYIYVGAGAMVYKRSASGSALPADTKFSTSVLVPVGIGLEVFAAKSISIIVDAGYRVTDDYPDGIKNGKIDGYGVAKVGVNFYFGTSDAEREALAKAEARRIKDSTDAAIETETRRVKALTDAEALRVKALADAEAQRVKDSTDAEARRLAELNAHRPADTVIVLERGKTVILKGVNFEFNKATLTRDSETILEMAFRALRASPDLNVLIVGHTDHVGGAVYNKKLSLRRAQAVKSWMIRKGIAVKRLTVAGKGFDEPIDDNTTADGRANNRRIEFRVLK